MERRTRTRTSEKVALPTKSSAAKKKKKKKEILILNFHTNLKSLMAFQVIINLTGLVDDWQWTLRYYFTYGVDKTHRISLYVTQIVAGRHAGVH